VVAMAIVRDLFSGTDLAKRLSYIGMFMMAAPLMAPAVGTFLLKYFGWRSIFSFLSIYSLLVIVLITLFVPETSTDKKKQNVISQTASDYLSVILNIKSMALILSVALGFSGMYTFITGSSKIYIDHFNIPIELFPLLFGSNVLLMIILSGINARLVTKINPQKIVNVGLIIQLITGTILYLVMLNSNAPFVLVFMLIVLFVGVLGIISGNIV